MISENQEDKVSYLEKEGKKEVKDARAWHSPFQRGRISARESDRIMGSVEEIITR